MPLPIVIPILALSYRNKFGLHPSVTKQSSFAPLCTMCGTTLRWKNGASPALGRGRAQPGRSRDSDRSRTRSRSADDLHDAPWRKAALEARALGLAGGAERKTWQGGEFDRMKRGWFRESSRKSKCKQCSCHAVFVQMRMFAHGSERRPLGFV